LSGVVHEEVTIDFDYESPEACQSVPDSTAMRKGDCFDNILHMYTVLSKEIMVYLDPIANFDYDTVLANIENYSDFITDIASTCAAPVNDASNTTPAKSFSPQCQASH
jgi:hypothetical protein